LIDSTAVWALPFLFYLSAAIAASISITHTAAHSLETNARKDSQEKIAHIKMSCQNKKEIAENTARHQPQQIKDCG
jgi:hypothetical protein